MTKDPEILEILDNWSDTEIDSEIRRLQQALKLREKWEALSRNDKDAVWRRAG